MIRVYKDYHDIPRSLVSPKIEKAISELLVNGNFSKSGRRQRVYNLDVDVKDKLKQIYFGKCAYCESIVETPHIGQYRPKSIYYWIAYEWSNLLLACPTCNIQKSNIFPIIFENKRIVTPQVERLEWRADSLSFRSEEPLLINPEIDNPEEHLSFHSDGRVFAKTEKGKATIDLVNLNREALVVRRMQIINDIVKKINYQLYSALELISKQNEQTNQILKLAFEPIFNDIVEHTKPQSEFSSFYQNLLSNFEEFVIKQFDEPTFKQLLKKVQDLFLNNNVTNNDIKIAKKYKITDYSIQTAYSIQSIQIRNIKCFEDTKIIFGEKNTVLLGVNGRGKTTILQLLALGLSGAERPLFESEWKNIIKNNTIKAGFDIKLKQGSKEIILNFIITDDDKISNINQIQNKNKLKELYPLLESATDIEQFNMWYTESNIYEKSKKEIEELKKEMFFVAYGTGRNAEPQNFRLNENFKNIASLFGINSLHFQNGEISDYLKQGNAFLQIKRIITSIFNQADEIYNRIELSRFDENSKTFLFKTPTNPNIEIPLSALSAGFRTSFQWILDFVVRAWKKNFDLDKPETIYGIVIIDELDTHLHIKWQRTIISALQDVFKNVQFIITTHSPFIVQSFSNQNIISLQLIDDKVIAKNINIEEGSSYESIIKELFGEKATFSVEIEKELDEFYIYLKEIRNKKKSINDAEFKKLILQLNQKGEEIGTIVSLELRQLKFETNKK